MSVGRWAVAARWVAVRGDQAELAARLDELGRFEPVVEVGREVGDGRFEHRMRVTVMAADPREARHVGLFWIAYVAATDLVDVVAVPAEGGAPLGLDDPDERG